MSCNQKLKEASVVNIKRLSRGRKPDGEPNPVDVHVGARIRKRRVALNLSQERFAKLIGITFQQVQKYERAVNRVGASRLWDIAKVLEVPVGYFYEDMGRDAVSNSPMMIISDNISANGNIIARDPMDNAETVSLVNAYYKIRNRKIARKVFKMMQEMAKAHKTSQP